MAQCATSGPQHAAYSKYPAVLPACAIRQPQQISSKIATSRMPGAVSQAAIGGSRILHRNLTLEPHFTGGGD